MKAIVLPNGLIGSYMVKLGKRVMATGLTLEASERYAAQLNAQQRPHPYDLEAIHAKAREDRG